MQTATNQSTGQKVIFIDNQWLPVEKSATGRNGKKAYFVSGQWLTDDSAITPDQEPSDQEPSGRATRFLPNYRPIQEAYGAYAEPIRHFASAIAAEPIADVAGLATPFLPDFLTGGREPQEVQNLVRSTLTYDPKTQAGKAITESPLNPINMIGSAIGSLAEGASSFRNEDFPAYHPQNVAANFVQEGIPQGLALYGAAGKLPPGVKPVVKGAGIIGNAVLKGGRAITDTFKNFTPEGQLSLAKGHIQDYVSLGGEAATKDTIAALKTPEQVIGPVTSSDAIAAGNIGAEGRFGGAVVRMQDELARLPETSTKIRSIEVAQENARKAELGKIAGTPSSRAKAEASVTKAGKAYDDIKAQRIRADATLENIQRSPSFKTAENHARKIAQDDAAVALAKGEKTIPFSRMVNKLDKNGNVVYETKTITTATGRKTTREPVKVEEYSAQGLQYIKQVMDDMAETPTLQSQMGITGTGALKAGLVRNELKTWMDNNVAGWKFARENYKAKKDVINQMNVGQVLIDKLVGPRGERAGQFMQARQNAPQTIKKATGKPVYRTLEEFMTKEQMASINKVYKELSREEMTVRMTGEVNLPGATAPVSGKAAQLPSPLYRPTMVANWFLRRGAEEGNIAVNKLAADIISDPAYLAKVLEEIPPAQRMNFLNEMTKTATRGAAITAPIAATGQNNGR